MNEDLGIEVYDTSVTDPIKFMKGRTGKWTSTFLIPKNFYSATLPPSSYSQF